MPKSKQPTLRDILEAVQSLASDTDAHFDTLEHQMEQRFIRIEQRLDAHDKEFVTIQDMIATSHDQIIGRLECVEQEVTFINHRINEHEELLRPRSAKLAHIR